MVISVHSLPWKILKKHHISSWTQISVFDHVLFDLYGSACSSKLKTKTNNTFLNCMCVRRTDLSFFICGYKDLI